MFTKTLVAAVACAVAWLPTALGKSLRHRIVMPAQLGLMDALLFSLQLSPSVRLTIMHTGASRRKQPNCYTRRGLDKRRYPLIGHLGLQIPSLGHTIGTSQLLCGEAAHSECSLTSSPQQQRFHSRHHHHHKCERFDPQWRLFRTFAFTLSTQFAPLYDSLISPSNTHTAFHADRRERRRFTNELHGHQRHPPSRRWLCRQLCQSQQCDGRLCVVFYFHC